MRQATATPSRRARWWAGFGFAFALLAALCAAQALTTPTRTGYVTDEAGIIDPSTARDLAQVLARLERDNGIEVVVVTLRSLQGVSIETWGNVIGESWNIGGGGARGDGALLIVAASDRKVRIAVGDGLADRLSDAEAQRIISGTIIPRFRGGDLSGGVREGAGAILEEIDPRAASLLVIERSAAPASSPQSRAWPPRWLNSELLMFLGVCLVFAFVLISKLSRDGFSDDDGEDTVHRRASWRNNRESGWSSPRRSVGSSRSSSRGSFRGGASGSW